MLATVGFDVDYAIMTSKDFVDMIQNRLLTLRSDATSLLMVTTPLGSSTMLTYVFEK
jgi:hypothetical protein